MNDINLYINYDKVVENISYLKKDKEVCIMVKANSYGMGFNHIKKLITVGYTFFGVTTLDEALEIREYDKNVEVMVFAPIDDFQKAIENNIIVTVTDNNVVEGLRYHIKIDTGMGRLGFQNFNFTKLKPEGIFTHFPMAANEEFSKLQIAELKKASELFPNIKYIHIQNTLGAIKYDIDFCNMVRIGIGQFGYLAGKREASNFGQSLKPALRLEVRVVQYKENFTGPIGYDLTENVSGNIATIRMGYHDGLLRCFQGYQFNSGAKIVGLICMCQAMLVVDEESDYIEIFGEEENIYSLLNYGRISTYEFLVSFSARVNKIEVNDE